MKTVAVSGKALPSPGTLKNRVNTLVSTEVTTIMSSSGLSTQDSLKLSPKDSLRSWH